MKKKIRLMGMAVMAVLVCAAFGACSSDSKDEPDAETGVNGGVKAVDLGLTSGVKWADRNIGASMPQDYGDYFSWGEMKPKLEYKVENSKWFSYTRNELKRMGVVDSAGNLTAQYDVATQLLGDEWRMPTLKDIAELFYACEWRYKVIGNVVGYEVTGQNGNKIFFPLNGNGEEAGMVCKGVFGNYWLSSVSDYECQACSLRLEEDVVVAHHYAYPLGFAIRPVMK